MDKIVLVEDDKSIAKELLEMLKKDGFAVKWLKDYPSCQAFLEEGTDRDIFLYLLDVNLPGGSGFDLCRRIRKTQGLSAVSIIMLTVLDDESSTICGLDGGADDYVSKPFSPRVLRAKIAAIKRRGQMESQIGLISGELRIRLSDGAVYRNGERLNLSVTDLKIVGALVEAHGSLVHRAALHDRVWDCHKNPVFDNTLSVHISRLRDKLGTFNGTPYIKTERGLGYRWGVDIEKG